MQKGEKIISDVSLLNSSTEMLAYKAAFKGF